MSSPKEFYNSLPPISKAYGTLCLLFTTASQFGLIHPAYIALIYRKIFTRLQVWRLITNFFFLGPFSINFGIRLLMMARYGVQLENGPFQRRTADFLWMMTFGALTLLVLSAIPWFRTPFLGVSLVFMLLYVWSREFPDADINIYGLVTLKAFYLPWAMLALDIIFGSKLIPDLLGIIAGHVYYFLTVLYPLSSGKNILKTPMWVFSILGYSNQSLNSFLSSFALIPFIGQGMPIQFHLLRWRTWEVVFVLLQIFLTLHRHKLVRRWRIGAPTNPRAQPDTTTGGAFRGRSYRLGG